MCRFVCSSLSAGKIIGKTIYLGYFENSTRWDREYVNKVEVYTLVEL